MKKGKLKKILASSAMGIMALAMPFTLTGCEKDTDINVRVNGGYIQWQEENADSWNNLITIEEVKELLGEGYKGEQGNPGINGKEVEFQSTDTHIQWRYVTPDNSDNWKDLIELSEIKGDPGKDMTTEEVLVQYDCNFGDLSKLGNLKGSFVDAIEQYLHNVEHEFHYVTDSSGYEYLAFDVTSQIGNYFALFDFAELGLSDWFDGWYYNGQKINSATVIGRDALGENSITLVANWKKSISDMIMGLLCFDGDSLSPDYVEDLSGDDKYSFELNSSGGVTVFPNELYSIDNDHDSMVVRELVLVEIYTGDSYEYVFKKITNLRNWTTRTDYYEDELGNMVPYENIRDKYNTVYLPETVKLEQITEMLKHEVNVETKFFAANECINTRNNFEYVFNGGYAERKIGYCQDFAIERVYDSRHNIGEGSLIYKLDWENCEAELIDATGVVYYGDTPLMIEDFSIEKNGERYSFKIKEIANNAISPQYNCMGLSGGETGVTFMVSENLEKISAEMYDFSYMNEDEYDSMITAKIFSKSKIPNIDIVFKNIGNRNCAAQIYYYMPLGSNNVFGGYWFMEFTEDGWNMTYGS